MPKKKYIGCCVDLSGRFVSELVSAEVGISYQTFRKYVSGEDLRELFPVYGWGMKGELHLVDDWHVSYHRSKYKGKYYYYIKHSGIEYIWN